MIVFDTDHLSILQRPESPQYERLVAAIDRSTETEFATTVISLEEQTRGWLAAIGRKRNVHDQLLYYTRLKRLVDFYASWNVVPFNEPSADRFVALRKQGVRIATMDLKIASIALANDALLLSANLIDFQRVPDLRVEDWIG